MDHQSLSLRDVARRVPNGEVRGQFVYFGPPWHGPKDQSAWLKFEASAPYGILAGTKSPADDWRAIKDYVLEQLDLPRQRTSHPPRRQPRRQTSAPVPAPEQQGRISAGLRMFGEARDLHGTVGAEFYRSRKLCITEDLSHVLRWHPGKGCIVALFRDNITNEPCGIHRTFVDGEGRKLGRKMLGKAAGAAIKLDAHEDVALGLHIGEGVETCLAARQLGYRPTWALGSANKDFPVLAGIEAITVFVENDDASQKAALAICARYEQEGCEAWICEPPKGDMNDTIREAA